MKRLGQLVYCRKKASDGRKALAKLRQNIVAQRIAFYACQKEFEDSCLDFV